MPFHDLGVATSNLTFFRQIGGSVSLAIVGTIFGTTFKEELVPQVAAAGVPQPIVDGFGQAASSGGFDINQLAGAGVGFDLGKTILGQIPAQAQAAVAPFIDAIVQGIYDAFSLAVAQTFYIGVAAAAIAAIAAAAMIEHPLRTAVMPNLDAAGTPASSATAPVPVSTTD